MPETSQHQTSPVRKLAAILFADIAGYTALMQHDEQAALEKLARFKETLEAKTADFQGQIIQYYGDGCLVIFDSPVAAVACAETLQMSFQSDKVPVRIGIHLGDVVFKEDNVFGDAVNIASRIESLGVAGAVLLSQTVRRQIKNHPEFQLVPLGSFEFKNVDEPLEVFALANEGFPVPKREEMEGKLKTTGSQTTGWKRWAWAASIALVALAAWLFLKNATSGNAIGDAKFEKSIAVLPFKNLSGNPENQYFCDGMMDEIFSRLSKIADLWVISPQSTKRYRGSDKPIAEIAKELGVSHLLEGSVQRSDDSIKIILLLIHAGGGRPVWSDEFTRAIEDIFALQSEIAKIVAKELNATIAPDVMARLERVPTTNMEAWNTYLEAHASYVSYLFGVEGDDRDYFKTLALCNRALAKDSTLAEAWTLKAQVWWERNYWRELLEENFMDSVAWFSRKALALNPQSAVAHSMLGRYFLETGQPEPGREYLEKAVGLNPNEVEAHWALGNFYNDAGMYEKALSSFNIALKLAPNSVWSPKIFGDFYFFYLNIGDLEKSAGCLSKAKAMSNAPFIKRRAIGGLLWNNVIQGNFEKAIEQAEEVKKIDSIYWLAAIPALYGYIQDFEKSIVTFETLKKVAPYQIQSTTKLRWAYALWKNGNKKAGMEMFKEAENEFLKTMQLGRESANANYDLAGLYAFLGQKEKAWQYLRAFDEEGVWGFGSPYFIQVDPLFENLRNDPKFKQMLQRVFAEKAKLQEQIRQWETEGK